ncbi:peptide chain release factor N(5)-glutamine methyltransferase [Clostridiales bacterium]|nr:peptide chain release factor N(5)-glutamine methyltransferase [Clostridiales bacterium]
MNPRSLILEMTRRFRAAGIPDPEFDSAALLASLCGRNPLSLRLDMETEIDQETEDRYRSLCARRIRREPLQYITGESRFCGYSFAVTPSVLIPRPETELLCEWAVEKIPVDASPRILDLCCGSGCIGITLKLRIPSSAVYMSDLSSAAADVARRNAERLSADVSVGTGDLFENIRDRNFDLIISNPPYIPENECSLLQEEVKKEPLTALDGGNDGLDFYRRICREAPDYLRRGGILMFELGDGQHSAVGKMMEESGFQSVEIRKDFRQISRMISGLKC